MTKKMMMFAAACLLVVFTAIPCFAEEVLKDGVVECACICDTTCPVIMPGDITAQADGFGDLKDCVSDDCDCDCVRNPGIITC